MKAIVLMVAEDGSLTIPAEVLQLLSAEAGTDLLVHAERDALALVILPPASN